MEWRQKLDTQRGAVLANELRNNACKLAKWTVQALLAGSDQIKFGYVWIVTLFLNNHCLYLVGLSLLSFVAFYYRYVSRAHVRDSSKHVILGTQQYKPNEFAAQINLNMDNAWGILRCIVDLVMKQKDGKFLIMKDPNKVLVYSFHAHSFPVVYLVVSRHTIMILCFSNFVLFCKPSH